MTTGAHDEVGYSSEDASVEMAQIGGMPAFTVLMHRTFPTYTESVWINAYPRIRSIVITHPCVAGLPGLVKELPVGWRDMASPDALRSRFDKTVRSYTDMGWQIKPHRADAR